MRATRRIPDPATRAETRRMARAEFERNRHVTDLVRIPSSSDFSFFLASLLLLTLACLTHKDHIRYLLSTGKTEWENMERYIDGL